MNFLLSFLQLLLLFSTNFLQPFVFALIQGTLILELDLCGSEGPRLDSKLVSIQLIWCGLVNVESIGHFCVFKM